MTGVVRKGGEGVYSTWHGAWHIVEAFFLSFRYNVLTFICKDYDATCQTSRGYGVIILSLWSDKSVPIPLHYIFLILLGLVTKIYEIAYQCSGQARSRNRSTDQCSTINLAPDVSVSATFAEGSSVCVSFQQHEMNF